MALLKSIALWTSLWMTCANAIPTIHAKGAKLFDSNGNQFFVKGIAYQLVPDDPLLDVDQCSRDVALMQTLGTNSIRVYHVDPSQSHDDCMTILANAGIYLWLDLDTFTTQIDEGAPRWNATQYSYFAAVMDAFAKYDNLGGFWIGNEVIRTAAGSIAAPYVKAATADLKAYRTSKSYRNFLIGYSAADIAELRPMLQNYLACGDEATSIEAFGLNSYEWCGTGLEFKTSGYSNLQAQAENYSIPIFFSETGCNVPPDQGRTFEDQAVIFGPEMGSTWSGAIIYEWIQEANHYGLITFPNGGVSGEPTPVEPDFSNLKNQWKNANPVGVKESDYTPSFSAPACPGPTIGWNVDGNPPLPTLGVGAVTKVEFGSTSLTFTSMPPDVHIAATSVSDSATTSSSASVSERTTPPLTAQTSSTSSAAPAATTSSSAAAGRRNEGWGGRMVAGVVGVGILMIN